MSGSRQNDGVFEQLKCVARFFVPFCDRLTLLSTHALLLDAFALHPRYAMVLVLLLGLFTGYIGCCAMMLGPEQVQTSAEREAAGLIDSMFLIGGLAVGSLAGMGIEAIVGSS